MKELTRAEEQIMLILWDLKHAFVKEIQERMPEPKPAYNTVLTIVRILEKKGFVSHETFCKANRYYPLISKSDYSHNSLSGLVKNYFNNSYSELVSAFTQKESFTIEQLEELKNMIDKALKK